MRRLRTTLAILAAVTAIVGDGACRGALAPLADPPAGLPYASAVRDCAPWDGPAVTITLTPTAGDSAAASWPQVRISVWRGADTLPGNSFQWPTEAQVGTAMQCTGPGQCVQASQARVSFRARQPDGTLDGSAELTFTDGTTLRGGFRAPLQATRVPCG